MSENLAASASPTQNHLLASLPAADYEGLLPDLELVSLPLGMAVYESGGKLDHVYFPTDCIVSLLYVLEDGASAEIAVVGREGLVGVALFMGGESTSSRAVVQSAGNAYRLPSKILKREFEHNGPLQHLLLRYTQALILLARQGGKHAVRDRCSARSAHAALSFAPPGHREVARLAWRRNGRMYASTRWRRPRC